MADISTLRLGEALHQKCRELGRMQLTESDYWDRLAKFAIEQIDARRSVDRPKIEEPADDQ